ncbi:MULTISPECIES: ROK family protein [unclassified Microbacterium]|uniref:ROK family protein n=1 Tax=unclassified Microbacterium TaxID=2609290 RepID=UPI000EAAA7AC|nr:MULTISPECIES: ROK family protein [unclassified Microbacterium]MBT2484176.1 ROK family protein [Microbacterium sp. ISL-108]RKN69476.1 ROK family protein [Microbacterium sp. CGR2]
MTGPEGAASVPDIARDAAGDALAAVRPLGAGAPVLAFDVGGTDIKSALFDADGRALGLRRTPTPTADGDRTEVLLDRLEILAAELRAAHPDVVPGAAGLVVPGIVDADAGLGVFASNLGWHDSPLRDLASARLGLPVAFDHDVRAASWAERRLGGARDYADAVVLVIGTGIAGALLVGGVPYTAGGYAGEIGHSPIADGPQCACGARGCLEVVASAGAIARRYADATGVVPDGAKDVIARAVAGDPVAGEIWDSALDALTLSLAQLTAVVAPEAVVIGGGLSRAGGALFDELRTRLAARLSFHRLPVLVPAELSGNAGLLGAALRAREVA